jgi:hypothetical protein
MGINQVVAVFPAPPVPPVPPPPPPPSPNKKQNGFIIILSYWKLFCN